MQGQDSSKHGEINRVQPTMLIEGLIDFPNPWTSQEARDGWYLPMDEDCNGLGGQRVF